MAVVDVIPPPAAPRLVVAKRSFQGLAIPVLVVAFCGFLFFYGLGAGQLYRTEGLRAIIAAEFLRTGNWIVPMLYGEPLLTKPPGMYAAIALASWPQGQVTEWSARLPSALASSGIVLVMSLYFRRQLGCRRAPRAVVHDHLQPWREPRRFCFPVADDGGRSDDQRRRVARGTNEVSEDGRRLAESHVERETSAEIDRVEETEPSERFGLIRAQRADEPFGLFDEVA